MERADSSVFLTGRGSGWRMGDAHRPRPVGGLGLVGTAQMVPDTRKWFHITTHTYAAWLPGDPRGFRTRHHREHVEGDYKNPPPPGKYADRLARSKKLLTQEPVKLAPEWRPMVGA